MGDSDNDSISIASLSSPKRKIMESGIELQVLRGHISDVTWVDFNVNKVLISSSNDKSIRIWKLNADGLFTESTDTLPKSPLAGHKYGVNCIRFSPFGTIIASSSTDGSAILWDAQTGNQVVRLNHPSEGAIRVCCFSPSSAVLATGGDDETICIWDISTRSLIRSFEGHEAMVTALAFTPDSLFLITGSTAGDLKIWDARYGHGKCLFTQAEAHDLGVGGLDVSSQYSVNLATGPLLSYYLVASCGNDDMVKLWHIRGGLRCTMTLSYTLQGHTGNVNCCRFSQDGSLLASASGDKLVIIWNPSTGTIIRKLEGHKRYVTSCVFSADNRFLATGSNDKTVIVWSNIENAIDSSEKDGQELAQDNSSNLIEAAAICLGQTNANAVSQWSVDDVQNWLNTLGLEEYAEIFKQQAIDGGELLHLTHDTLLTGLKINALGHRNKILRGVQALRNPLWQHIALNEDENISMPDELYCPITHEFMQDPVVASDGYSYEKQAINQWIASGNLTSPMTNEPLETNIIVSNITLKLLIKKYVTI